MMTAPATVTPRQSSRARAPWRGRRRPVAVVLFAPIALLNFFWFTSFSGRTLMGDDLDLLLQSRTPGGYASDFLGSLTQTGAEKFRPVVTVLLSVMTDLFGGDFLAYRHVNLALQLVNVALVGLLAWRLARRNWLVAAAAMALATVSRFNVYLVLQVFGLMESLAVTFLLVMLLAAHHFYESGSLRSLAAANLCYFLAVFTHERFMVLGGFLVVLALVAPIPFRSSRQRVAWAAAPVAVAAFNITVKSWVLGIDFFTGPGGQDVEFGPRQMLVFLSRAVLNVFGFNTGPDYLSGRNMHSLGNLGLLLGLAFLLPVCVLGAMVAMRWGRAGGDRRCAARTWLLGTSLFGPILLSASITFRQEFRWLYAPYVVLVLGVSWALGRLPPRSRLQLVATLAVLVSGLAVDGYYRRHVENTYFFSGLRTADSVREAIVERHGGELSSSTVFLVTHGDVVVERWYLRGGGFFDVYSPGADVRLVPSLDAALRAERVRPRVLAFEIRGDGVADVTDQLGPVPAP